MSHVVKVLVVKQHPIDLYVVAHLTGLEILMMNVSNMNVRWMMIVHIPSTVRIMNAETHVLTSFVVAGLNVRQTLIGLYVSVLLVYRATLWLLVLKLGVLLILNVPKTKSVIIKHPHLHERSANHYVETILVQPEPPVLQIIIEKYVLVTILFKEMDMCLVLNYLKYPNLNVELTKIVKAN